MFFVAFFLFMLSGLASKVFTAQAVPFKDIAATDWYCGAVSRAKDAGILEGYPDGSFQPEGLVTYAEFLRMAIKDALPVVEGHWAAGYYDQGVERNLFTEYEIRKGSLDQPIPRKYMALVFAGLLPENDSVPIGKFSDIDARSAFEYYIAKSAAGNLLIGYPDGTFRPEDFLTRAEAATAFVRLLDVLVSYEGAEEVPMEDIEEGEVKISDIADPFCLEYLNSILQTISFSGSDGVYKYSFTAPYIPEQYKNCLDISFFSPEGKQILIEDSHWSRNKEAHLVEHTVEGLSSVNQLGTIIMGLAIAPTENMNWLNYTLKWNVDKGATLRIQYEDRVNSLHYTEYSSNSLNYIFVWE